MHVVRNLRAFAGFDWGGVSREFLAFYLTDVLTALMDYLIGSKMTTYTSDARL